MATETPTTEAADGVSTGSRGVWFAQARAFTDRSLREVRNSGLMLAWVIAFPAITYLLRVTQGTETSAAADASVAIGTGVLGAMFVSLFLFGSQLATDLEDRRYAAYRSMPISSSAELAGRMAAGLVLAAGSFAVTIVVAVATGAAFGLRGPASVPVVLLAGVATCLFWMVVAVPFVVVAGNKRVASMATTLVAVMAFVLTGLNGVVPAQSPIDGPALNYLPNTLATRLLVAHLVPAENWTELGVSPPQLPTEPAFLALLTGYTLIAVVAGSVLVTRTLYDRGWWT
ncbi:ABC transporter permease [Natrinema sp. CGMCC1.2065]|uniref:ABC transporter permease n=1 Tax=Natrinema sp. CGMCC1.2065 TaxID=3445767 RepID=UPI003F4A139E